MARGPVAGENVRGLGRATLTAENMQNATTISLNMTDVAETRDSFYAAVIKLKERLERNGDQ